MKITDIVQVVGTYNKADYDSIYEAAYNYALVIQKISDAAAQRAIENIVKEREALLLDALMDARSLIDDYAPHAGEYLQEKYRLKETLAGIDAVIEKFIKKPD